MYVRVVIHVQFIFISDSLIIYPHIVFYNIETIELSICNDIHTIGMEDQVKIKAFSIYDNWHYNLKVIKKNMHVYFVLIISFINTRSTNAKKYQT